MINEAYWLDCPSFMEYVGANIVERLEKKYVTQQEMTQGMAVFASCMNFQTLIDVVKYANYTSRLQMMYVINFKSPVEQALFFYHIIEHVCKQTNSEHVVNIIQDSFMKLINQFTQVPIHDIKKRYKYVQPWDGMPDPVKPISDEDIFKTEDEFQQASPFIKRKYKTNRIINMFQLINEIFDVSDSQMERNQQAQKLIQTLLNFLNNNAIKILIEQLLNYDQEINLDRFMMLVPEMYSNRITHLKLNCQGQQLDKSLQIVKDIFPNLRTLDLQGLHYNYIDQHLSSPSLNLTYINLSNNNITSEHSDQLIGFLKSQVNLKDLHLNQNNLGPQLAKKLSKEYLAQQKQLVNINMSNCNTSCFTYQIIKHLMKSNTIKSINVAQNYFGESINNENILVEFIIHNQSIECLNLIDSSFQTQLIKKILLYVEARNNAFNHQLKFWNQKNIEDQNIQQDSIIFGYKPQQFLKVLLPLQESEELNNRIIKVQIEGHENDPLFQRRYYEKQLVYSLDNSIGDIFYGISERWLRQWRSFINGETQKVPLAIDNNDIKHLHQKQVQSNDTFRKVNVSVWNAFQQIYGGGPEVIFRGK